MAERSIPEQKRQNTRFTAQPRLIYDTTGRAFSQFTLNNPYPPAEAERTYTPPKPGFQPK